MPQPEPTLIPINLYNADEFAALQEQRRQCGWDFSDEALLGWRDKQDAKLKSFFWITIAFPAVDGPIRAGHISLDSYADPPDAELARADRSILTIQTFFVAAEYRQFGVGRAAMDQLEALATQLPYGSPRCQYLAVTTKSRRNYYDDTAPGVLGTGLWALLGEDKPTFCAADWYARRGYVWWKSEPRWPGTTKDGETVTFVADFMKKPVSGQDGQSWTWWSWGLVSVSMAVGLAVWWRRK